MNKGKKRIWPISNTASSLYFFDTVAMIKDSKIPHSRKRGKFLKRDVGEFLKKVSREMFTSEIEREREIFL